MFRGSELVALEEYEQVTGWGTPMKRGTPGNVTDLERLHVAGKYRDRSMQHTCSRHAAWDPPNKGLVLAERRHLLLPLRD